MIWIFFFPCDNFGFSALWERRNFLGESLSPAQSGKPWGYLVSDLQVVYSSSCCMGYLVWQGGWLAEGVGPGLSSTRLWGFSYNIFNVYSSPFTFPSNGTTFPTLQEMLLLSVVFRGCLWSSLKHHRDPVGHCCSFCGADSETRHVTWGKRKCDFCLEIVCILLGSMTSQKKTLRLLPCAAEI